MLPRTLQTAEPLWHSAAIETLDALPLCHIKKLRAILQCQRLWCWAAVLQELRRLYRESQLSQCTLVKRITNTPYCKCEHNCHPQYVSGCNVSQPVESHLPRHHRAHPHPIDADILNQQLCNQRPVVAEFRSGSARHYALVSSMTRVDEDLWHLEVADPRQRMVGKIVFREGANVIVRIPAPAYERWILTDYYFLQEAVP